MAAETMIERFCLRRRASKLGPGEVSAHSFQEWLGQWKTLDAKGWESQVVVARDGSHAIGLAYRPGPGEQLALRITEAA